MKKTAATPIDTLSLAAALVLAACAARAQSTSGSVSAEVSNEAAAGEPIQTIAAYERPPGMQWASATCQHVPCQLTLGVEQDPIKPFMNPEELKKAMREQEALTGPGSAVDLGDGRYAVRTGNGKAVIGGQCDGASCSGMPVDMSSIPGLRAKFDAQSNKAAARDGAQLSPDRPSADAAPLGALSLSAESSDDARPGYADGKSVASLLDTGSGTGEVGSGGPGASLDAEGRKVVLVDGNAAARKPGFTFVVTARAAALLPKFRPKRGGVFALPGEIPDPDAGAPAVPPLTRAERNGE